MKALLITVITFFIIVGYYALGAVVAQDISQWFAIPYLSEWSYWQFFGLFGVVGVLRNKIDKNTFTKSSDEENVLALFMYFISLLAIWGFFWFVTLIFM